MVGLGKTQRDLRNVLLYAQELIGFREKVLFDLAAEKLPSFHEAQLAGLEGIELNADPETWMRLRRLRETQPPAPDSMFDGWIKPDPHPSPDRQPVLLDHRVLRLPIEDISDLVEAGLLDNEDVLRPVDADEPFPPAMDVILRTAAMAEFRAAWRAYLDGPWAKWAEAERPRRRSIEVYNRLYQVHQRVTASGEDNAVEIVWGIGVARWQGATGRINMPIIEQLVETELLKDGTLLVVPRRLPPQMALRPFHALEFSGARALQRDASAELERIADDPDVVFSPFERRCFEGILRSCGARLSSSGVYLPDEPGRTPGDRTLPPPGEVLTISDTWVLYVRQRAEDVRKDDIQKLIRRVEEARDERDLPASGLAFVTPPNDERLFDDSGPDLATVDWSLERVAGAPSHALGFSWGGSGEGVVAKKEPDVLFPLPYNEPQLEILARLEEADGVVVQGPPGTGKTHTIANVICHYLATGRRVLVTSKAAEPLTALQEKLPEGVRDLAIAVLHNDREGARQLEQAVRLLADQAQGLDHRATQQRIADLHRMLAEVRGRMAAIDRELLEYARRNAEPVRAGGQEVQPSELARLVARDRERHAWFEDRLDLSPAFEPRFSDAEIAEAREIRRTLGASIAYRASDLPDPASLPDIARVVAAHGELARVAEIEERSRAGGIPYMAVAALDQARGVHAWLREYGVLVGEIRLEPWLLEVHRMLLGVRRTDEAALATLRKALEQWAALYSIGRELALRGVDTGNAPADDRAFDDAVGALARGEKPFGLFSFGKGALKERIARVTVGGRPPSMPEDWRQILAFRVWQRDTLAFLRGWASIAAGLGLPAIATDWERGRAELLRLGRLIADLIRFASEALATVETLKVLFPYGLDPRTAVQEGDVSAVIEALAANLEKADLAAAAEVKRQIEALAGKIDLVFNAGLREFAAALGDPTVAQSDLAEGWRHVREEAERLAALRPARVRLDEIAGKVRVSGAPLWAEKLAVDPVLDGEDPWTPADWRVSWEWARADGFLKAIGDRSAAARLSDERVALEARHRTLLAEVVRLRTFLGLKRSLTARIAAALAKFAAAIGKLGAGTGKSSMRHRRVIRDAALDAAAAVPCWILPEWRVSEQLPAELAAFDLVIVDEASQSDVTALPAILRGKKLLIVGDDKQVSPSVIGIEERTVIQLRSSFLSGLPFADQMDPATSLYELGGMLFPGKAILLREHFRCVEPIIRFSSRFYPETLVPMRLPKATERLDPPLVDILVRDGVRKGDVNHREADVIVEEIRRITEDPAFEKRSFGVISLIGERQAKLIHDRLMRELGAEVVERHRIMCGNAATFQGQERDIVLLSMVACPKTAVAQRARMYEQRFNVALSRARDRLILVRSVTSSDLRPGDLKLQVIEHFRNPFAGEARIASGKNVLDVCDSDFERDFGARLLELGYRIRPQVRVGGFRIDFVIEGSDDRRLAIELDGDRWHGPDRWTEDFRRQKALEQLGWTFWRCWASNWYADPEACLWDLRRVLDRMGIDPLGAEPPSGSWTEFREVSPPAAEVPIPEPATHPEVSLAGGAETVAAAAARGDAGFPLPEVVEDDQPGLLVEVGDLVAVRFEDASDRLIRVRLSQTENKPEIGLIHVDEPLGRALLGVGSEEEFEVELGGGKIRTGIVEAIEKSVTAAHD
ncbi:MAG TPA: AAA domain-containing protein [Azospirillaceae bacterium]|nr:AAA domain-containing protein [Azospirillaceae bacterium]